MLDTESATSPLALHIKSSTWGRDSHGLFDYESTQLECSYFIENSTAYLVRANSHVLTTPDLSQHVTDSNFSLLARFEPVVDGYLLVPCDEGEEVWLITRELGDAGIEISSGDVLKLGRLQFLAHLDTVPDSLSSTSTYTESSDEAMQLDQEEPRECRICFTGDEEAANPLLSPCSCIGSMKYIHYNCLKTWLDMRMVARVHDNFRYFMWKSLDCELCKTALPLNCNAESGPSYPLCVPDKGDATSIILETLCKDRSISRVVTAIAIGTNINVKLGRGHESDVRIPDISVSRCHAQLFNRDGRLFVSDFNSKFGTLVQVRRPILLRLNSSVSVQVGRSVLRFEVRSKDYTPEIQAAVGIRLSRSDETDLMHMDLAHLEADLASHSQSS